MDSLNETVTNTHPILTNVTAITTQLRDPHGSLGEWIIPTALNQQLQGTLASAQSTTHSAESNLNLLGGSLNRTLENVAGITSNLNAQVQANSLMLTEISRMIVDADDLVQGLKRNWLLKSSFKGVTTNKSIESFVLPSVGGVK
jgi:hypothetical protein